MPLAVLDALDALHLAFAFEVVPVEGNRLDIGTPIGVSGPVAGAEAGTGDAGRKLFILYINPGGYKHSVPGAASLTPAQGLVFPDDVGAAIANLSITGRFGAKRRVAHNREGERDVLSGHEQWKELEQFLAAYRSARAASQPLELRFHAFRYGHHYAVVLPNEDMEKGPRTRIGSPQYQIQMTAFRQLDKGEVPTVGGLAGFVFDFLRGAAGAASDVIDALTVKVAELRALVNLPARVFATLDPVLDSTETLLEQIEGLPGDVAAASHVPELRRLIALYERLGDDFQSLWHEFGFGDGDSAGDSDSSQRAAYATITQTQDQLGLLTLIATQVATTRGIRADSWARHMALDGPPSNDRAQQLASVYPDGSRDAEGAGRLSAVARRLRQGALRGLQVSELAFRAMLARLDRYVGWVPYQVAEDDSPYSVAAAQYGDPDRWLDIVVANELAPPFFGSHPSTARPGDLIRLPVNGGETTLPFDLTVDDYPEFNAEIERRVFGVDFALGWVSDVASERLIDLVVDEPSGARDATLIEGFPCFVQRMDFIVLPTERGTLVPFPSIGVAYQIGEPDLPDNHVLLVLSFREAILRESAVRRIRNETIEKEGVRTLVTYDIETVGAGSVRLRQVVR